MQESRRLVVIGAGVGGLATAIAARRRGLTVSVYDARPELPSGGGALLLWANGIKALRALDNDLEAAVVAAGTIVRKTEFRSWRGEILWELPMERFRRQYGAEAVLIGRGALCRLLERKARELGAAIRWNVACDGFSLVGRRVRPRLAIPPAVHAAALADGLVGADGIRSKMGTQLRGAHEPRYSYHVAWIGISQVDERSWPYGTGHVVTFLGGGPRFCAYTMATSEGRRTIYWYATEAESRPEKKEYLSTRRLHELFRRRLPAAADVMRSTVAHYPEKFAIKDLVPASCWSRGPVVLLGDAAHASTPDLGQGSCQALESAVVLAHELSRNRDVAQAFGAYARKRMHRTTRVTALSRATAVMSMIHAPGLDALRDAAVRMLLPTVTLGELDRLFRGEIPAMR